ncbi:hypothetical protein [Desulfitobacterium metallireducens]|uniref:Uncharacterized protein n=1 Tax=Desulfitobacterium metallireducens DSM 15288 TaxID=871968 RepID=W0EC88_9FIRM|nr:hypothetical protein [Desulfitobacterium metallireducens]AHF08377.1 hypothetical protein DESME_01085 [Desulfitobacterium metallireducens DSM 15288]
MFLANNLGVVYGKSNGWSVPILGILAIGVLLFFVGRASMIQPIATYN